MTRIRQMVLARRKERGEDEEAGFTLIELLVVLLIIAILLAIAVPTFLGARTSAENRAAQSNVRNALTDLQAYYVHSASFTGLSATVMQSSDPALQWTTGTTTSTSKVIVNLDTNSSCSSSCVTPVDQSAFVTAKSAAGECYQALLVESNASTLISSSGPITNSGTWYAKYPTSSGACAPGAVTSTSTGWSQSTSTGW